MYKSITVENFDPGEFLSHIDLSTEHKCLDLKNKIEASIMIWKRKMHQKDAKSSWSSAVSLEKRELFEERAETILLVLKQRFPGLPQSSLDICKIESNVDVGHAVLESYSRVLESLANTVMSRIDDVLYADSLAQDPSLGSCSRRTPVDRSPVRSLGTSPIHGISGGGRDSDSDSEAQNPESLSSILGWYNEDSDGKNNENSSSSHEETRGKPDHNYKLFSYIDKLEALSGLKSPNRYFS